MTTSPVGVVSGGGAEVDVVAPSLAAGSPVAPVVVVVLSLADPLADDDAEGEPAVLDRGLDEDDDTLA